MASPVRSFFSKYHDKLRKVSLFATKGGESRSRFAAEVEKYWNITAVNTVELRAKNVKKDTNSENIVFPAITDFIKTLSG
jgi:hypothetical protein